MSRLRAQHQVRKVDIPGMRRHVGTLGHEAHVTQVAVVHHFPVDLAIDTIELHGLRGVDRIEQCWKRVAEAEAAPAAVADLEHALELASDRRLVVELRIAPIDRVSGGRLQTPFTPAGARAGLTFGWGPF